MKINEIYCDEEVNEAISKFKSPSGSDSLLIYLRRDPNTAVIVDSKRFLREVNKHSYMLKINILPLLPFQYSEKLNIIEIHKPLIKYIKEDNAQLYFPITTQLGKNAQ